MASQMPKPSVPRPPIAHRTLATMRTRPSRVQPKAKALKMTTVVTSANAARRWRKRSVSYSFRAAPTLPGASDGELAQPLPHGRGDGAEVGLQAVVPRHPRDLTGRP